jgi:hypothetical protein
MNAKLQLTAGIILLLAACAPAEAPTTVATARLATGPTETVPAIVSPVPDVTNTPARAANSTATSESTPDLLGDYAALLGNIATGDAAPDFSARILGGSAFTLSEQRGSPVLVIPTIVGCGDCILILQEIAKAYPDYRGRGLRVMMLNLYPEDSPESWQEYVDLMDEPEFLWAVVDSLDFVIQYSITNPGTLLLVDRDGQLVFRSDRPIQAEDFRLLFDLATR